MAGRTSTPSKKLTAAPGLSARALAKVMPSWWHKRAKWMAEKTTI